MQNRNPNAFGGFMSILAGVLLLVGTGSYIFWPRELIFSGNAFYALVVRYAALYRFTCLTLAAFALAGIAAALAIKDAFYAEDRGLVRWASVIGLIGLAVTLVNFTYVQSAVVLKAQSYLGQHVSYTGFGLFLDKDEAGQITLAPFPGSPAEQAGIQTGDVLVSLNGQPIQAGASLDEITATMQQAPGDSIRMAVRTGSQVEREIQVAQGTVQVWDVAVQKSLQAGGLPNLDPDYLLGFGLTGLWLLLLNANALRNGRLPRLLAALGVASGLAYWVTTAGFVTNLSALILLGQVGGLTLGPAWFIWMGGILRRK